MIRSLGSSLLAKAGTGSLTRKKEETRITKPEIPGKAATGTAGRDLVEETNITPTAPGSEKVVRSAPGIESASLPGVAARQVPLVAGMGMTTAPGAAAPGANNQPMFQGGVSGGNRGGGAPASQTGQAGRQAVLGASAGAPMGAVATARANRAAEAARTAEAEAAQVQGGRVPFASSELPNIGIFGSRVSAAGGGESQKPQGQWQPTTGQYIAGAVGKAINTIGQKLGNKLPEMKVSENLQKYGGSSSVAAAGRGSVEKAVQNVSGALRSVVESAKNTVSKLRSKLFGR